MKGVELSYPARNVCLVQLNAPTTEWEQWVLLRSDAHHDNPSCDQTMEKRHLDEAKEYNALIIDNGDLFCAMQGKYDKRSSKDAIRPEHQHGNYLDRLVDTAVDFYAPYADNFITLGLGNHETSILGIHETNLTDRLAAGLRAKTKAKIQAGGYGGWVKFSVKVNKTKTFSLVLHHYHGSGGSAPVTMGVIHTNRIGIYTPDADIVLTGHSHHEWTATLARQRLSQACQVVRDEVTHIRVPGYKDAWKDGALGFETERMHGPKPKGAMWLRLYVRNDTLMFDCIRAK